MNDSPRVKGQTVKSVLLYAQRELTPDQYAQLIASLAPEDRAAIHAILPTSTFAMRLVNQITIEGARLAHKAVPEFARGAGRTAAAEGIRGVYRFFARVMTPEALLAKAASMWSSMNLAGTMSAQSDTRGGSTVTLSGYPSEEVMCQRIVGWIEQLAEMAGAKSVHVAHTQCVARGGPACEWHVTWK